MGSYKGIEFSKNLAQPTPDLSEDRSILQLSSMIRIIMIVFNITCVSVIKPFFLNIGAYFVCTSSA